MIRPRRRPHRRSSHPPVIALVALTGLGVSAAAQTPAPESPTAEAKPKPAKFDRWSDRLDYVHDEFHRTMHGRTELADAWLTKDLTLRKEVPVSRFRLGFYIEGEIQEGFALRLDPDFDADIRLPNVEDRWRVFLTGRDIDELPGTDPTERERGLLLGVQRQSEMKIPINISTGIKVRWVPEAFVAASWRRIYQARNWWLKPSIRGFYETGTGFGQVSAFSADTWFGALQRGYFRNVSAVRWTEETYGVELEQTLILGLFEEQIEERPRGRTMAQHHAAKGYGIRGSVFGHKSGSGVIDRYRLTFAYRHPLYKQWLYGEIAPEVSWRNTNDWEEDYVLRLGIDMLFWGTSQR